MYNFPSQSVVTLYLSFSDDFRCKACFPPKYFGPKSLTAKVKLIGRLLCVHNPWVLLEGRYPKGSRCFTRLSCDILVACGSTYIPLVTHAKVYPFCAFPLGFFLSTKSSGIMDIYIMIYSTLSTVLFRKNNISCPCTYILI